MGVLKEGVRIRVTDLSPAVRRGNLATPTPPAVGRVYVCESMRPAGYVIRTGSNCVWYVDEDYRGASASHIKGAHCSWELADYPVDEDAPTDWERAAEIILETRLLRDRLERT